MRDNDRWLTAGEGMVLAVILSAVCWAGIIGLGLVLKGVLTGAWGVC